MRAFAYKNTVWKSSWYQKHAAAAPVVSPTNSLFVATALGKPVQVQKSWHWGEKAKNLQIGHKGRGQA
jgi:hypothetical protein